MRKTLRTRCAKPYTLTSGVKKAHGPFHFGAETPPHHGAPYVKRFLVLLLALVGCATGGSSSYQQAAPAMAPVRPPAVRPVVNGPMFSQPRYTPAGAGLPGERVPGASVPRSEGRLLPRTDDPGVWAADGDPALMAGQIYGWDVLGVRMPVPENCDRREKWIWSQVCANRLRNTVNSAPDLLRRVTDLAKSERECLLAALFYSCLEGTYRSDPEELREIFDYKYLPESVQVAAKFRKEKCNKTTVTERVVDLSREVQTQLKERAQ